jgi:hypothetical protein
MPPGRLLKPQTLAANIQARRLIQRSSSPSQRHGTALEDDHSQATASSWPKDSRTSTCRDLVGADSPIGRRGLVRAARSRQHETLPGSRSQLPEDTVPQLIRKLKIDKEKSIDRKAREATERGFHAPSEETRKLQASNVRYYPASFPKLRDNGPYHVGEDPLPERVLIFKNLSKTLVEDDFRRLIPEGGEYLRVFPVRDPFTLQQSGNYTIVFPTAEAATAYRDAVYHTHLNLVRKHTRTSIFSKQLDLPPNFHINGENVSRLIKWFAILPNRATLSAQRFPSLSPTKTVLAMNGGYKEIVGREGKIQPKILFRVQGVSVSKTDIAAAIHHDGRERNLPWNIVNHGIALRQSWTSDLSQNTVAVETTHDVVDESNSKAMGNSEGDLPSDSSSPEELNDNGYNEPWVLTFATHLEAQRFARAWHMRPFPVPPVDSPGFEDFTPRVRHKKSKNREQETLVLAEVLW